MRTIAVVTVARSDYGIYVPVLRRIAASPVLRLHLVAAAAHLSAEFGFTVDQIARDGFEVSDRVEMLRPSDSPEAIAESMALGLIGFSHIYGRTRPDLLLVLGDRFEMFSAALAAVPFGIPIAHVHGGEVTEGAIDDALRHAMTKLSHLHFVSTAAYAHRVEQLGEEPWRIVVSGAPALDHLGAIPLLGRAEFTARFGVPLEPAPLLVTFHPVTLEPEQLDAQVHALFGALDDVGLPIVFTQPNADTGGRRISALVDAFVRARPQAWRIDNLGTPGYFSLLQYAAAMVGNSSSGIIEAPSFGLPVINIGSRQSGRIRAGNVIDVPPDRSAIAGAIARGVSAAFRDSLRGQPNPYGAGDASRVIADTLASVPLDARLLRKRFHDLRRAEGAPA